MTKKTNGYDLEERTAKFGEAVIKFCLPHKQDTVIKPIISQLIRSATSIGANYMEANGASSKKDFANIRYLSARKKLRKQSIGLG